MAFHITCKYFTTFDVVTPSQVFYSGFPPTTGRSSWPQTTLKTVIKMLQILVISAGTGANQEHIQCLIHQAYPNAALHRQDILVRGHFVDAFPESEVQWCIPQGKPKSLQEALTTAFIAHRHQARFQNESCLSTLSQSTSTHVPLQE